MKNNKKFWIVYSITLLLEILLLFFGLLAIKTKSVDLMYETDLKLFIGNIIGMIVIWIICIVFATNKNINIKWKWLLIVVLFVLSIFIVIGSKEVHEINTIAVSHEKLYLKDIFEIIGYFK